MVTTAVAHAQERSSAAQAIEQVLIGGDLAKLTAEQRLSYYQRICDSLGLNPLTRPLEYLVLNGKMTLYARKDCTDQLRKLHGVSIERPEVIYSEDLVIVSVSARDASGRTDSDLGAVPIAGLKGEARANAVMKCLSKAKRRVTLSLCGLGMLDESEVEGVPDARHVVEVAGQMRPLPPAAPRAEVLSEAEAEMVVLREELAGWFDRYPDARRAAQALLDKEGKSRHGDARVREMVARLRKRADEEKAARRHRAAEGAVIDEMTPAQRRADTVESGRRLLVTVAGRPGEQPTKGDIIAARAVLRALQHEEPAADDVAVDDLAEGDVVGALATRMIAANAAEFSASAAAAAPDDADTAPAGVAF